ncbi:MAG: hypothetical protein ACM3S2_01130 [Ignavibacteriales bacterium]
MAQVKKNVKTTKKSFSSPFTVYWEKQNYYILALGIILLVAGYYVMSLGKWDNPVSLVLSPILLVLGYLIVLPAAIFYKKRNNTKENI